MKKLILTIFVFFILSSVASANPIVLYPSIYGYTSFSRATLLISFVALAALSVEYILLRLFLKKAGIQKNEVIKQFLLVHLISFPLTQWFGIHVGYLAEIVPILVEFHWYKRKWNSHVSTKIILSSVLICNLVSYIFGLLAMNAICTYFNLTFIF